MRLRAGMDCSGILVLAAALLAIGATQEVKFTGFLGCRFSKAVCQASEECIDDHLFGSCQTVGSKQDGYRYALDRETLHLLESEITRLVQIGYTWSSLYTQCTVGNILLAFRLGVQPDRVWCDQGGAPPARYQEALSDDDRTIVDDYFNDYYNDDAEDESDVTDDDVIDVDPYIAPEKKDEYVTIHKYFKDKREDLETEDGAPYGEPVYDMLPPMDYETSGPEISYETNGPEKSHKTNGPEMSYETNAGPMRYENNAQEVDYEPIGMDDEGEHEEEGVGDLGDNLNALVNDLRPNDLLLLKSYLREMDQSESAHDAGAEGPGDVRDVAMEMEPPVPQLAEDEASKGYVWDGKDILDGQMPEPTEADLGEVEMTGPTEGEYELRAEDEGPLGDEVPSLSPPDAKLLGDLLQDKVDVDALSDGQIQRLLNHVDSMLNNLEDIKAQGKEDHPRDPYPYPDYDLDLEQHGPASSDLDHRDLKRRFEHDLDPPTVDDGAYAYVDDYPTYDLDPANDLDPTYGRDPEFYGRYLASSKSESAPFDYDPTASGPEYSDYVQSEGSDEQSLDPKSSISKEADLEDERKRADGPIIVETVEPTEALPDPHDHAFDEPMVNPHTEEPKLTMLNTLQGYMHVNPGISSTLEAEQFLEEVEKVINVPQGSLTAVHTVKDGDLIFEVNKDVGMDAEMVAKQAMGEVDRIQNRTRLTLEDAGVGDDRDKLSVTSESTSGRNGPKYFVLTFVLCGSMAGIVLAVIALYVVKRHSRSKDKLRALGTTGDGCEASKDYQDLCRQRMQTKSSAMSEVTHQGGGGTRVSSVASESAVRSPSSRSSTSSWSEEPVASNMDISTGHIVLSYMEDHLKNKDRLSEEWDALCAYEAEPSTTTVGAEEGNKRKNRYSDVLPYDHSRVILSNMPNVSGSDYVNANTITDHDPRNPAYIATQGPLPHTVADFWQLVWEQGSVVIVCLSKLTENGVAMCHRYWPEEGSDLYHTYEVHLVSEHIWCDDYLVRSFYLKNLHTNETRTVTQFHFLTWPDLGIPASAKSLLDFRRKVNKSYRGRSCPIIVHCSDGVGRTGTYCLIDMVLNRMSKGAKEIDIAATLEHIRDQRASMVKTKEQFEFALASVADEVHAILKALPQ